MITRRLGVHCSTSAFASTAVIAPRLLTAAAALALAPTRALLAVNIDFYKKQKQKAIEARKRKELERQGLDPDDGDEPWVDADEQARLDAEAAEKDKVRLAQEAAIRAKRDKEDAEKRAKFSKWRAAQISMSDKRRAKGKSSSDEGGAGDDAEGAEDGGGSVGRRNVVEVLPDPVKVAAAAAMDPAASPPAAPAA